MAIFSGNVYANKFRVPTSGAGNIAYIASWGGNVLPATLNGSSGVTWSGATTYIIHQIIVYSGRVYRSLAGGNLNRQPDTNPAWWADSTLTINGTNQLWQCSDPTLSTFYPMSVTLWITLNNDNSAIWKLGARSEFILLGYANGIDFRKGLGGGFAGTPVTRFWGDGLTVLDATTTTTITPNSSSINNSVEPYDIIFKKKVTVAGHPAVLFPSRSLFADGYTASNSSGSAGMQSNSSVFVGACVQALVSGANAFTKDVFVGTTDKLNNFASCALPNASSMVSATAGNFNNFPTTAPAGFTNNVLGSPNYNNASLFDFTVTNTSVLFRSGLSGTDIGGVKYGIPCYNLTAYSSKDSSLPTIGASGFTQTTYKELHPSEDVRITRINLVGARNIVTAFNSINSSGVFTVGGTHTAPTDAALVTGRVCAKFKFRNEAGVETPWLTLPFNEPIGYDSGGKTYFEAGYNGTIVTPIFAKEALIDIYYPNSSGASFEGVTYVAEMNLVTEFATGAITPAITGRSITGVTITTTLDNVINAIYSNVTNKAIINSLNNWTKTYTVNFTLSGVLPNGLAFTRNVSKVIDNVLLV